MDLADFFIQGQTVEPIHPNGYQTYLETGNRLQFEKQYFGRRKQLVVLGLAAIEKKEDTAVYDMLEKVIWEICNEYTWALPAHLEIVDGNYLPNSQSLIDLFAAETAQTLAEILEYCGEHLSGIVRRRICEEIESRIFIPFESRRWQWEELENNWSAVIAGCIGMTSLSILPKDSPRQARILKRLEHAFQRYLHSFTSDGVCEEGVSYWVYGFGYYLYFAEKYQSVYQDNRYLADPQLLEIAAFPYRVQLGEERFVPFSDAHAHQVLPSGLLSFCHENFQVPVPMVNRAPSVHFDHCYRWAHLYRNLNWTKGITETPHSSVHFFPEAEWFVIKELDFLFAAKGGRNNVSHNHNDVGHFLIGSADDIFLTDLGAGEYTRDYFLEETRYEILNNRSLGHSVPVVNGYEQEAGPGGAKQTNHQLEKEGMYLFEMDISATYPEQANLQSLRRTWQIHAKEKKVILTDLFSFTNEEQHHIQQNFVSYLKPEVWKDKIYWQGKKNACQLVCSENVSWQIFEENIKNHQGEEEIVYRTVWNSIVEQTAKHTFEFTIVER